MAQIVTFIVAAGLGLMLLVVGSLQWVQQRRNLANAQPVQATITHAQVVSNTSMATGHEPLRMSNSSTTHRPDVRFRYTVDGHSHESDLLYPSSFVRSYASRADAEQVLAPFPVHAAVSAYVDRAQPDKAFLISEASNGPAVFIVLGLVLPPLGWLVGKWI
jgi:hypothetical protein